MQNRLTIKDIARLSGVGKSTVSRVLNNESGVSERTRERVEAVMNQHGFSPSRSARAMRGQSDKVVAIIVTRLDSLSENLAVQTMLPAFYEQGYDPIMMESQFSPTLVMEHLGMLRRRNIDGVVLFGFTGITEELIAPRKASRWCCWQEMRKVLPPSVTTTRARFISLCSGCMSRDTATLAFWAFPIAILPPANVGMTHTAFCKNINFIPSPPCPVLP